ncbi:hypothetical protein ACFQJC_04825 [Haloferax namakaokahaiae]|uniref:Uncharacterized protein n=1 Tax=Haloferax namakaokahaiae TaxID=1748331 RepID=A0ABD5ZCE2_9EURY
MSAREEIDWTEYTDEDVMLPTPSGGVLLEGPDGEWVSCGRPVEVRQ